MRVGICEDEVLTQALLSEYIKKTGLPITPEIFPDGEAFFQYLSKGNTLDILFLDIGLGEKENGILVAQRLRGTSASMMQLPLIIFVTAYPDYMPEAFSLHAYHYLVKPFSEKQFQTIFRAAVLEAQKLKYLQGEEKLKIQVAGSISLIPVKDIYYMESFGRKVCLHRREGTVEFYGKFSDLEKELPDCFFKTHRSFLVNLNYVYTYQRTSLVLENGETVPVSKYRHEAFLQAYMAVVAAGS